ncbi:MAG: division/cell wall cluster transcriptional repressor MraZ [Natronospirillum sp.]|uniref:division/cell wall cluster transcriptional repressor MraZ n=1 Tax=Natronospirillum sp. TaxID=2812955 RepID=UPI0025E4CBBD|nr:division/cell wall cluster transcriptional repressor MraZ [Natronospirillum sp.]MCH8551326.1 division/cell wall cluster transcriptional repressor MraZ [Natronospirillum sp.]
MLRGVHALSMDSKGRMAIPSRFRDAITQACQGELVLTIDTEELCLLLYPLNEWEVIQQKIEALPSYNRAVRRIQRLLIGHATDIEMDGNGRILVPGPLRDHARLDKKVVLLGQGNKFEVWDEQYWQERRDAYLQDDAMDIPEAMQELSL